MSDAHMPHSIQGCVRDTGHAPFCETPTGDHTDSGRDREHNDALLVRCQVVQLWHFDSTESRQRRESATVSAPHARQGNRWGEAASLSPSIENKPPCLPMQEAFQRAKPRRNPSLQARTVCAWIRLTSLPLTFSWPSPTKNASLPPYCLHIDRLTLLPVSLSNCTGKDDCR